MSTKHWRETLITPEASLREAMARMGAGRQHILLIVDRFGKLLGTVTDGDLRRVILQNATLDDSIGKAMQRNPLTAPMGAGPNELRELMRRHDVQRIPIVDQDGCVIGLAGLEDLVPPAPSPQPHWVVLMAGGRGQRLRPLTDTMPKPMLPIGGKPILEAIIRQFAEQGFSQIYVTVNYLAEKIRTHFGDGAGFGAKIFYLEESQPLGTAGSLSLLPVWPHDPLIVMNADILARVDFVDLIDAHRRSAAAVTVCVRDVSIPIPYGVVNLAGKQVSSIVEKPDFTFQVSAGIYVLTPDVLRHVRPGAPLDMPDLVNTVLAAKELVSIYSLSDYWLDIGRVEDFSRAVAEFSGVSAQPAEARHPPR